MTILFLIDILDLKIELNLYEHRQQTKNNPSTIYQIRTEAHSFSFLGGQDWYFVDAQNNHSNKSKFNIETNSIPIKSKL